MKTEDFNFDLPPSLIAQYPTKTRGESRLFVLDRGEAAGGAERHIHTVVGSVPDFIEPGTLMVFNNSRVRKARIYGTAEDTNARVEFLLLGCAIPPKIENNDDFYPPSVSVFWRVLCSKTKKQKIGRIYSFPDGVRGTIEADLGDEKVIRFDPAIGDSYLERNGHMPLPPYIKREDESIDSERYQTIYAKVTGSAASPTAGLHFTEDVLGRLAAKGIEIEWVTLHVGLGTFLPVRTSEIEGHAMHEEIFHISEKTARAVNGAKKNGRRVLAVGTTSLRALESAWSGDGLAHGTFNTRIFIYPGYRFKVVDELFTNFHTPMSTLLMLVSAFAGRERILNAYQEAIAMKYRFFSYGDAMLIL